MLQTLIAAVKSKEIITFTYNGHPRVVEPHAIGLSKAGHKVMRCFQIGGSHDKDGHDWDLMLVSKIVGLTTTGEHFASARPGYKRGDKGMTTIYAQL